MFGNVKRDELRRSEELMTDKLFRHLHQTLQPIYRELDLRLSQCEQFIPASYTVESRPTHGNERDGWYVVKNHPILGLFLSQGFPSKACAQKALDEYFTLLLWRQQ